MATGTLPVHLYKDNRITQVQILGRWFRLPFLGVRCWPCSIPHVLLNLVDALLSSIGMAAMPSWRYWRSCTRILPLPVCYYARCATIGSSLDHGRIHERSGLAWNVARRVWWIWLWIWGCGGWVDCCVLHLIWISHSLLLFRSRSSSLSFIPSRAYWC